MYEAQIKQQCVENGDELLLVVVVVAAVERHDCSSRCRKIPRCVVQQQKILEYIRALRPVTLEILLGSTLPIVGFYVGIFLLFKIPEVGKRSINNRVDIWIRPPVRPPSRAFIVSGNLFTSVLVENSLVFTAGG